MNLRIKLSATKGALKTLYLFMMHISKKLGIQGVSQYNKSYWSQTYKQYHMDLGKAKSIYI